MRKMMMALLIGAVLGATVLLTAIEISGGWYTYAIWDEARCHNEDGRRYSLGSTQVAPNQPHPCLFRTPRWGW